MLLQNLFKRIIWLNTFKRISSNHLFIGHAFICIVNSGFPIVKDCITGMFIKELYIICCTLIEDLLPRISDPSLRFLSL